MTRTDNIFHRKNMKIPAVANEGEDKRKLEKAKIKMKA